MSIPRQITDFLNSRNVAYRFCTHSPAYTAQGTAHAQHVSGKDLAKVVMVMADDRLVMTVLPASHRVDLDRLAELLNAKKTRLAAEEEFKDVFPGCELGAMPPLGNLYNLEVWLDTSMEERPEIVFNAGTHVDSIQMRTADLEALVQPKKGSFGILRH